MQDGDYENDILLEEDEDTCFDYEESRIPKLLTDDDLKQMKT
jgi:hypothetical protein